MGSPVKSTKTEKRRHNKNQDYQITKITKEIPSSYIFDINLSENMATLI